MSSVLCIGYEINGIDLTNVKPFSFEDLKLDDTYHTYHIENNVKYYHYNKMIVDYIWKDMIWFYMFRLLSGIKEKGARYHSSEVDYTQSMMFQKRNESWIIGNIKKPLIDYQI